MSHSKKMTHKLLAARICQQIGAADARDGPSVQRAETSFAKRAVQGQALSLFDLWTF